MDELLKLAERLDARNSVLERSVMIAELRSAVVILLKEVAALRARAHRPSGEPQ